MSVSGGSVTRTSTSMVVVLKVVIVVLCVVVAVVVIVVVCVVVSRAVVVIVVLRVSVVVSVVCWQQSQSNLTPVVHVDPVPDRSLRTTVHQVGHWPPQKGAVPSQYRQFDMRSVMVKTNERLVEAGACWARVHGFYTM